MPLSVTMSPEIPTNLLGTWATRQELGTLTYLNSMFNGSQPGGDGKPVSNEYYPGHLSDKLGRLYYADAPLADIVSGCGHGAKCQAMITAPAIAVNACTSWELPVDYLHVGQNGYFDRVLRAPSLDFDLFFIATQLIIEESESINVVAGYADTISNCTGTLHYTACNLQSAIGLYNVSIQNDLVTIDTTSPPRIVALANNTRVNHTVDPQSSQHPSTLGAMVVYLWYKWNSIYSADQSGNQTVFVAGNEPAYMQYSKSSGPNCVSRPMGKSVN